MASPPGRIPYTTVLKAPVSTQKRQFYLPHGDIIVKVVGCDISDEKVDDAGPML